MADTKPQRGRPKGSGINDDRRLQDIARLLVAEPGLKPTTAIRSLGYSNPSAIRRLRDKLNADLDNLLAAARNDLGMSQRRAGRADASYANADSRADTATSAVRAAANHTPGPSGPAHDRGSLAAASGGILERGETESVAARPPRSKAVESVAGSASPDVAGRWIELSFQAGAVAMRHHVRVCAQLARVPSITALLQQQMLLAELLVGAGFPNSAQSQTRH